MKDRIKRLRRENIRTASVAFSLLVSILVIGIIGYMLIEDFSFTDAVFMTIITIATVGFREVHPLSDLGMWFTSFLIIFSFGIFAYAVTTLTRYIVDGVLRNYYKHKRLRKRIRKLKGHVIICGYGRNGRQAATELLEHNVPIVVVEQDEEAIEKILDEPELLYVNGDATQDEVLEECQIDSALALITTLPIDAHNLFVVLTAREKNPNIAIISRASEEGSGKKLKRAGATNVIMPDKIGGQRMAKLVAQPDVVEFLDFIMLQSSENVMLEEISCVNMAHHYDGKSIRELEIANDSGANIVGMKRSDNSFVINPLPEVLLTPGDKVFVLGTRKQISRLKNILNTENH